MVQTKLPETRQVTIPADILQEWRLKHQVKTNDRMDASRPNAVLPLVPSKHAEKKRDLLSFAGAGKGLWGLTEQEIDATIVQLRDSWTR